MPSEEFLTQARPAEVLREAILRHIRYTLVRPTSELPPSAYITPVSLAIRDRIVDRLIESERRYRHRDQKRLYYISMEFLVGRSLANNLSNLKADELCREVLAGFGISLDDVLDSESDAGLGIGGLGSLAASVLESMASLAMPGFGYGINYEFGLFRQEIVNGLQREKPDFWKANGTPFHIEHPEDIISIPIYGRIDFQPDDEGRLKPTWSDYNMIVGIPSDMPIVGYLGQTINWLRLFTASSGDYFDIDQKVAAEDITRVINPYDSVLSSKERCLVQQYFLVSCAIDDIMRRFRQQHGDKFELLPSKVAIQMNDTHTGLAVVELMRVLLDEHEVPFEEAWELTRETFAYTIHTPVPDAFEKWSVELMEQVLPRHLQIIIAIDHQHAHDLRQYSFMTKRKLQRMSIIQEDEETHVRMSNLCTVGSHSVNGVSAMHTEVLKTSLASEFYQVWPEKFCNKTNGVSHRRWLMQANPELTELISHTLDENKWITSLDKLRELEPWAEDPGFRAAFREVKRHNKLRLQTVIQQQTGVVADPDSMFDVHIKHIHESKRQLLNVMRIVSDYLRIVEHGELPAVPRTYIFAGKATPGDWVAKQIIKLIHDVAEVINTDSKSKEWLKLAFLPDYRVSLAELIIPGADLSEQISTAGTEPTSTGGMKLAMSGALTIGTWDGANVEIAEEVGLENIYIFGLRAREIAELKANGTYSARRRYEEDPQVKEVLDALTADRFSASEEGLFAWIFRELVRSGDKYFHIADFPSYMETQRLIEQEYLNEEVWGRKAVLNVARIGKFSSDRMVHEYARDIWHIGPYEKGWRPARR